MDFEKIKQIIGLMAATLTTTAFIPQVIQTWRNRSAKDISLGMFLLFCGGVFMWLIYGLLDNDLPVIVANFVTFILAFTILVFKFKYG